MSILDTDHPTLTVPGTIAATTVSSGDAGVQVRTDPKELHPKGALEIGEKVGEGGMGVVSRGLDRVLQREVAIKSLRPGATDIETKERALIREAQIMGQLAHPHIVPVQQLGRREGHAFFSMQLMDGGNFEQYVREARLQGNHEGRPFFLEVLDIVVRICDTLSLAHARGVVHCDIKPANIIVAKYGCIYLIDWGIARLNEEWSTSVPFSGTPGFAAPEQVETGAVDPRTDIYAIGALLYYAFTARTTVHGRSLAESIAWAKNHRYPPIETDEGIAELPSRLVRAIQRCLAYHASDRFESAEALKAEIQACSRGEHELPLVEYAIGEAVVLEGDVCSSGQAYAYLIAEGRCEVVRGGTKVRELGPGEVFGEPAVLCMLDRAQGGSHGLAPIVRTATVRALTPLVLQRVDVELFKEALQGIKHGVDRFVFALARRFIEIQQPEHPE